MGSQNPHNKMTIQLKNDRLIFVTQNRHKLMEAKQIFAANRLSIPLAGLDSLGFSGDIPEVHDTLEENAVAKSNFVYRKYGCDCFADDTGLEVHALDGRPGVYSARYAGTQGIAADNIAKLLNELHGVVDRTAQFRTVVSLILNKKEYLFEGVVHGEILTHPLGEMGFGYDPVFKPAGHHTSFSAMDVATKNSISHRYHALKKMIDFLSAIHK